MNGCQNIKKVCGFYISSMHLVTMLLPYIKNSLSSKIGFSNLFEYNLKGNVEEVLSKIMGNEQDLKDNILELNWDSFNSYRFSYIEKEIKDKLKENKELNILIVGSNKYVEIANENLNRFFTKHIKKLKNKYITVIDCYEVSQFNDNIKDILDAHESIINTSGIHDISEVFDGYQKKVAN